MEATAALVDRRKVSLTFAYEYNALMYLYLHGARLCTSPSVVLAGNIGKFLLKIPLRYELNPTALDRVE